MYYDLYYWPFFFSFISLKWTRPKEKITLSFSFKLFYFSYHFHQDWTLISSILSLNSMTLSHFFVFIWLLSLLVHNTLRLKTICFLFFPIVIILWVVRDLERGLGQTQMGSECIPVYTVKDHSRLELDFGDCMLC